MTNPSYRDQLIETVGKAKREWSLSHEATNINNNCWRFFFILINSLDTSKNRLNFQHLRNVKEIDIFQQSINYDNPEWKKYYRFIWKLVFLFCTFRQCDQIGWFLKIPCVKVSFKIIPNVCWLLRLFGNIPFQVKTAVANFWATFGKLWATFNFNILSRCIPITILLLWNV